MITFRPAWPDELERAARVCTERLPGDGCFLAVEDEPVERIIGAAFWRLGEKKAPVAAGDKSASAPAIVAEFDWRMLPRHAGTQTELELLAALRTELQTRSPATLLKTRGVIRPDCDTARILGSAGFRQHSTNILFAGSHAVAAERHSRMRRTFGQLDASNLAVVPPDASHAEALKRLIGQREGLLSPAEIDLTLRQPFCDARAFDPEWSGVLLEMPSRRVIGAELIRFRDGTMTIPAVALDSGGAALPGQGWFLILGHWLELCRAHGWAGDFHCRVNPDTNPVMLKMAGLFGYRELERTHSYAIALASLACPTAPSPTPPAPTLSALAASALPHPAPTS